MSNEQYTIGRISLMNVRNKNEIKVIDMMKQVLSDYPKFDNCTLCYQDVYALSLNALTPHYIQTGTIMLKREAEDPTVIEQAVRSAFESVIKQPKHP